MGGLELDGLDSRSGGKGIDGSSDQCRSYSIYLQYFDIRRLRLHCRRVERKTERWQFERHKQRAREM